MIDQNKVKGSSCKQKNAMTAYTENGYDFYLKKKTWKKGVSFRKSYMRIWVCISSHFADISLTSTVFSGYFHMSNTPELICGLIPSVYQAQTARVVKSVTLIN